MSELLHEVNSFRAHPKPGAVVQWDVAIQNPVHNLTHGLLMALL